MSVAVVDQNTGAPDAGFSAAGADGPVLALAADEGGRLLVGGAFSALGGTARANLGRLNADGTDDATFDPGDFEDGVNNGTTSAFAPVAHGNQPAPVAHRRKKGSDGPVSAILHTPAGGGRPSATFIAGQFSKVGSQGKSPGVAKLDGASGRPDPNFSPGGDGGITNARPPGGSGEAASRPRGSGGSGRPSVNTLGTTQGKDGKPKLLLAGAFNQVGNKDRSGVARISADDGSVDADFDPGAGTDGEVRTLSVQADGKAIIGGTFSSVDTQPRSAVARLLGDGDGAPATPAFFNGQADVGNGVNFLRFPGGSPFGYYSFLADPHYLFHFDLGYEYVFDAADGKGGVYLYDFKSNGFFYTSPSFPFPYLYDFSLSTVIYYFPDPNNPGRYNTNGVRYFVRLDTGQIITK